MGKKRISEGLMKPQHIKNDPETDLVILCNFERREIKEEKHCGIIILEHEGLVDPNRAV